MKILFDTNVILDVLLNRYPFVDLSTKLVGAVENKEIEGYLCATSITTLDYLITKAINAKAAKNNIQQLLMLFEVAEVSAAVIHSSLQSEFRDFEDAVQYYSAEQCGVGGLVTRNIKDYRPAKLPIYLPEELWGINLMNRKT